MPFSTIKNLRNKYLLGELEKDLFIKQAGEVHALLYSYSELVRDSDVHEIRIGRDGIFFRVGSDGLVLSCPAGETRVAPIEALNFGRYEPIEAEIMVRLILENSTILDVGANIGWYSLLLALKVSGSKVHAFEPVPLFHQHLQLNIERNEMEAVVHAYQLGFSDAHHSASMFLDPGNGTNASLLNVSESRTAVTLMADISTLDDWCATNDVWPDFIKCDVEGAELLVLRGARGVLESCKPVIFLEMLRKWSRPFGYHPNDIIIFLREYGYSCFAVAECGLAACQYVSEGTLETNYVFLNRGHHVEQMKRLGIE